MSVRRRRWTDTAGVQHEAWLVDVQVADKGGRVRRIQRVSPINNRRAAEKLEHELREELLNSEEQDRAKTTALPTFSEFAERFMTTYAMTNNKASEVEAKRTILRVHLLPQFGTIGLDQIGVAQVEAYKATKLEAKLARKSINNQLTVLRKILSTAVDWHLIPSVPKSSGCGHRPRSSTS